MKIRLKLLAFVLAILMSVVTPMHVFSVSDPEKHLQNTKPETLEKELKDKTIGNYTDKAKLYVSDIKIATGKTAAEAQKSLRDAGYLVYDNDLNEGTYKDGTYIGYKITTDRTQAITDLRVMDENGGYDKFSYKDFAEGKMPGIQSMVLGMQESCKEMRKKLKEGSYAAKVAKEYLDLFCVPKSYKEKTGEKLGDYLLSENRTEEEFRDLILVLNSLVLDNINSYLALGISDSELLLTQANGGLNTNGYVSSTYTSRNGITGYTELVSNNGWLQNAAETLKKNTELQNVNKSEDSQYFADKMAEFGGQVAIFKSAYQKNTLSSAAIDYLDSEVLESKKGPISTALGLNSCTALDLFKYGSDRLICLYISGLPEICEEHRFVDVLEICASDCEHRIPKDFTYNKQFNVDWAPGVVESINTELLKPSDKNVYNDYNSDIESFVNLFQRFTDDYEKAIEKYNKNKKASLVDSETDTLEKAKEKVRDSIIHKSDVGSASAAYYVAIKEGFAKFTVSDGKSNTPLLDYLIQATKGKKASDVSVKAKIYPVVKALGTAKNYSYKSNGMFRFFVYALSGADVLLCTEAGLEQQRLDFEESLKSKDISIWIGSNRDLVERNDDAAIAMTSQRVADILNSKNFDEVFPNEGASWEKYQAALIKCSFAVGSAFLVSMAAMIGIKVSLMFGAFSAIQSVGLLSGMVASAASIAATVCCVIVVFAVIALIVITVVIFVLLIILIIALLKPEPTPVYSKIPDIMLDCVEDENNYVTDICRYNVVTDLNNKPADINAFSARKWTALYYTKNADVGSPLTLGENGEFFTSTKANTTAPAKSVPLAKFLTITNFNLNSHCYSDTISGKYLYFYTEDSLKGIKQSEGKIGKYIDSIVIGHSKSRSGTEAYVKKKKGYQILNINLSQNCGFNTFLAFHTTDDKSDAITDIRAAFHTDAREIYYGDNKYYSILDDSMRKVPAITCEDATQNRKKTSFSYGLYVTKSPNAGDPILAEHFEYTTELSKIPKDADTISYFAGVPLDFNTCDYQGNSKDSDGKSVYDKHYYVYYTSEREKELDYNKTYIAGLSFFSGSDDQYDKTDLTEYDMEHYAKGSYGCTLIKKNLTPGILNNDADVTYLGYVTTHNPKRGLTELAVFTGEPKSIIMPQNIVVSGYGYCSCEIFTQGDYYYYYGSGGGYWQRQTRYSHAYFTADSTETYQHPDRHMARALYGCGPQSDVNPIEISDLVFSTTNVRPAEICGNTHVNADLYGITEKGIQNLDNKSLGYNWHSVHAIDQYYYDKYDATGALLSSYDIGLGIIPNNPNLGTGSFYIYYRNGTGPRIRGNYVSNVLLTGSIVADNSYNEARCKALSGGADIVNLDNPLTPNTKTFNDMAKNIETYKGYTLEGLKKYHNNCYLLSVSYTNDPLDAVGNVRILKQVVYEPVLPSSMSLPLYDLSRRTSAFRQTGIAPTSDYEGYASYTSHDGTAINRVELRFINTNPSSELLENNGGSGAAEYYAQSEDTLEPFIFETAGTGKAAAICLQRSIENGRNEDYYIMDITVTESTSADGNMGMAAAKLGAMGYPYMVDFDIAESALSDGSNTVAAIGIKRTTDPTLAIKDIKISSDDLGETYVSNNMKYRRVNSKPICIENEDKNGVYLYVTDGSDSRMILWKDVDKENTDWKTFDWYHLDFRKSGAMDINFTKELGVILKNNPTLRTKVNEITNDENNYAESVERLKWSQDTAITNIGYVPSSDCPALQERKYYNLKTKDIYWAGCPAYGNDKLPVSVTSSTRQFTLSDFSNIESASGLRVTNGGNSVFTLYESTVFENTGQTASVFTNKNIVTLTVLSVIAMMGLAAVYIVYKKKKSVKR